MRREGFANSPSRRATCERCHRPDALCYCELLVRVANRTPVVIVQHPRERFHPLGTVRLARNCLERIEVVVDLNRRLRDASGSLEFEHGTALLYPSPEARDLSQLEPAELPRRLVVIDGTWNQAQTLYRDIPALHPLPKVRITPSQPSAYRIRREPRDECLSTVEALIQALRVIEPETRGFDQVIQAFRGMIDLQIRATEGRERRPRRRIRNVSPLRGLPRPLIEDFERFVVVYGECIEVPDHERAGDVAQRAPRRLVHWVARRLSTRETFSALVAPDSRISPGRLLPLDLSPEALSNAGGFEDLRRRWREFSTDRDIYAAWNPSALQPLDSLGTQAQMRIALKAAYCNLERRLVPGTKTRGSLEDVCAREGLDPQVMEVPGRAGRRLVRTEAVARLLHSRAITCLRDEADRHSAPAP